MIIEKLKSPNLLWQPFAVSLLATTNKMSKIKTKKDISSDLEQSLLSTEKLDRASPDIWPERNYPGIEYVIEPPRSPEILALPKSIIPQELDKHDYTLIGRYSKLTAQELIVEVKQLQNLAYQLGLEEAKEMTRGKYLNILSSHKKRNV